MFRSLALFLFPFPVLATFSPAAESSAADRSLEKMPLVAPDAGQLAAGANTSFSVPVPELNERERKAAAGWRGVVGVDLYGTLADGKGGITLDEPTAGHEWRLRSFRRSCPPFLQP